MSNTTVVLETIFTEQNIAYFMTVCTIATIQFGDINCNYVVLKLVRCHMHVFNFFNLSSAANITFYDLAGNKSFKQAKLQGR